MPRAGRSDPLGAYFLRGVEGNAVHLAESVLDAVAEMPLTDDSASLVAGGDATFQGVGTIEGAEASLVGGGDVGLLP